MSSDLPHNLYSSLREKRVLQVSLETRMGRKGEVFVLNLLLNWKSIYRRDSGHHSARHDKGHEDLTFSPSSL